MTARLLDTGDAAVTMEFGDRITGELVAPVDTFERTLDAARVQVELAGVVEPVPTFGSLTVLYDPLRTRRALLDPVLLALLQQPGQMQAAPARHWRLSSRASARRTPRVRAWPSAPPQRGGH